jgi:phosphatidylcholine synthase
MVHLLTASGAVAGLLALICTARHQWQLAFAWMGVTLFIDAIDGALARLIRVKEVLPYMDGALLDNMVDYFTFVLVPAYFLYEADIFPEESALFCGALITVASAYQFSQTEAKVCTTDYFFTGFPSYWNIVVFYMFMLQSPAWLNLAVMTLFGIAVFIPIRYIYPSRTHTLRKTTLGFGLVWAALLAFAIYRYPDNYLNLIQLSLIYVVYYFLTSFWLTWREWKAVPDAAA